MQNNKDKPGFLPIFNRKKRPRQALLAHPNNTSEIAAKQCKFNFGQSAVKYQYESSQQSKIQNESISCQGKRNKMNRAYQSNAGYQGNYQEIGGQASTVYQGTPTTTNSTNKFKLTQQRIQTGYKPGGRSTGGIMQRSLSKPQQQVLYGNQQPSNRASNKLTQRTLNRSVNLTSSQWQTDGTAPSQDLQAKTPQLYSNLATQNRERRVQPTMPDVTKTSERMKASNEHLAPETLRFITASIQSVRHWSKYKLFKIIFEVYGQINSTVSSDATNDATFFTMKDSRSTIKCIFYETDRSLPKFIRGQWLRCIGTLDVVNDTLHCVSVRQATQDEQRMRAVRMSSASKALGFVLASSEQ